MIRKFGILILKVEHVSYLFIYVYSTFMFLIYYLKDAIELPLGEQRHCSVAQYASECRKVHSTSLHKTVIIH